MIMMLFMALYQMVDAVFVSNFVSETALSALNIVYPLISFIIAVAVMLATGGSAVIAKKMGEGEHALARQLFSMVVLIGVLFGIAMTLVGIFFTRPLIHMMGSTPALDPYCYDYLYTLMLFSPFAVLQLLFQTFLSQPANRILAWSLLSLPELPISFSTFCLSLSSLWV